MKTTTIISTICLLAIIFGGCRPRTGVENSQTISAVSNIYCENRAEIREFLVRHSVLRDANPTHQEASNYVTAFVQKVFERQYTDNEIPDLITRALQLFWSHSIVELEDSPDFLRWTTRRSMLLMSLAFLSGELNFPTFWFLTDARNSLNTLASDLNAEMLLMVNLIEIYFASRVAHRIPAFQEILNSKQAYISENFFDEYNQILLNIKANAR